ncbi:MAG: hypothetical protein VR68_05815 [Peptococcaceae bacterium BRH_c4a]|nr:MAG: hypothetical protein VR68_05815 [Peptococcaceae bacterium BRH_c4a]
MVDGLVSLGIGGFDWVAQGIVFYGVCVVVPVGSAGYSAEIIVFGFCGVSFWVGEFVSVLNRPNMS